jgi:hypothetical protein
MDVFLDHGLGYLVLFPTLASRADKSIPGLVIGAVARCLSVERLNHRPPTNKSPSTTQPSARAPGFLSNQPRIVLYIAREPGTEYSALADDYLYTKLDRQSSSAHRAVLLLRRGDQATRAPE